MAATSGIAVETNIKAKRTDCIQLVFLSRFQWRFTGLFPSFFGFALVSGLLIVQSADQSKTIFQSERDDLRPKVGSALRYSAADQIRHRDATEAATIVFPAFYGMFFFDF